MASTVRVPRRHLGGILPLRAPRPKGLPASDVGMAPRRAARRIPWRRFLVLATLLYGLWIGHIEWRNYHQLAVQETALRAQAAKLRQKQALLQGEVNYAGTNQYVSEAASQEFGLVKPGEVPLAPVRGAAAGTGQG